METNQISTADYLQRQLIDMIELAKHSGTNAVEFVQAQAPDVVRQIIVWEITEEAVFQAAMILPIIAILIAILKSIKTLKSKNWDNDNWRWAVVVVGTIVSVFLLCVSMVTISQLLKPIVAPKLFLIEYTTKLFKNK